MKWERPGDCWLHAQQDSSEGCPSVSKTLIHYVVSCLGIPAPQGLAACTTRQRWRMPKCFENSHSLCCIMSGYTRPTETCFISYLISRPRVPRDSLILLRFTISVQCHQASENVRHFWAQYTDLKNCPWSTEFTDFRHQFYLTRCNNDDMYYFIQNSDFLKSIHKGKVKSSRPSLQPTWKSGQAAVG